MGQNEKQRFELAINVISTKIKMILYMLPEETIKEITEIRLRINKPVVIVTYSSSNFLTDKGRLTKIYSQSCVVASHQEISDTFNRVCSFSLHSYQQNINNGFITINGGHRVGLAGTSTDNGDGTVTVKDISCINIRIARQVFGVSSQVTDSLFKNSLPSIIIAGAPSTGKTTFLRDLAYRLSSGYTGKYIKTCVLDERGEFSAIHQGIPQNDLGLNCDIMVNYKKSRAVETALRSLSPEYIIFDEICSSDDIETIKLGLNSGVGFAVSVHCGDEDQLKNKDSVSQLIKTNSFDYCILLNRENGKFSISKIFKTDYLENEIHWRLFNDALLNSDRSNITQQN